jgi:hypothetical protein
MTLALLVAFGTLAFWVLILLIRSIRKRPTGATTSQRAVFAAAGLSGAFVGGGFPVVWAMVSNVSDWWASGRTGFTFAGHLPPGVDEDDLLVILVIGMAILMGQAVAEARRVGRR